MYKPNNQNATILTPAGYKPFKGVQRLKKECFSLTTTTFTLTCATNHRVCTDIDTNTYSPINMLSVGSVVYTKNGYECITKLENVGIKIVYDIVGVESNSCYYSNGILSHNCKFLQYGDGAVDYEFFDTLIKNAKQPIHIYDEERYFIWVDPAPERIYVAGVDTAEGIGKDYSIINIYDITDLQNIEQVALYATNRMNPYEFTTKVLEILNQWGKPLAFVERNGPGAQVADTLKLKVGYERLVSWGGAAANRKQQNGIISHTNTKHKAVTNMRYWLNELKVVRLNDQQTIKEFKEFIRKPNGSWAARDGYHDDRVMSSVWALIALHEELCGNLFEIVETDDNNKPKKILPNDLNMNLVINPQSIYMDDALFKDDSMTLPCVFGMNDSLYGDIEELKQQGWSIL